MDMDRFEERMARQRERFDERMARRRERWHGRSGLSGMLFGGLVIVAGLVMLLDNLNIIRFHDLWRYWPVIVVVVGVIKVLEARSPSGYVFGGMVALVGSLILLDNLEIVNFSFDLIWPLLIIAFGISVLLRQLDRKKSLEGVPATANPDVSAWVVFSGIKRKVDSQDFKGGDVVAVFGGVNIDLRNAAIAGERAVIDLNLLFGGVDIRVPETWNVVMKGVAIFGAFEDKTTHPKADPNVKTPELVITGAAMFAGVNAKN
jgi:predicted membrane protein